MPGKAPGLPHAALVGAMMCNDANQTAFGMSLVSHARIILALVSST